MNYFIKNIHVNKLFHLNDFDIPIADKKYPHLIITGKNGSGKTILLNAISNFLSIIRDKKDLSFLSYTDRLLYWENKLKKEKDTNQNDQMRSKAQIELYKKMIEELYGNLELSLIDFGSVIEKYNSGNFIISFYQAYRKVKMSEPKNPTKPVYNKKGD